MPLLRAAGIYFALVFGAGFVLGPVRMLWLVPKVGARTAELMELPIMLTVVYFAAKFVVRQFPASALATGLVALAMLLAAEISLGMILTENSLSAVLFDRDPVSGTAYYLSLLAFGLMPWWLAKTAR